MNTFANTTTLKKFIEDGLLALIAKRRNLATLPIMKLHSVSSDGNVRVILGGICPACNFQHSHQRNICCALFVRDVMSPIIHENFNEVNSVSPVLTFDNDFEEAIRSIGARCSTESEVREKQQHRDILMRKHPNIDSAHANVLGITDGVIPNDKKMERDEFNSIFTVIWLLDETTSIVTLDGRFVTGPSEVGRAINENNAPSDMEIMRYGENHHGVVLKDKTCFSNEAFIDIIL